jgi:tyrosyl-tRNA synthetase
MTLIEELKWRGLVSNMIGGISEQLEKESTTFYVGTDPTGKSLHVGHLLAFVVARLMQNHGHKPIILVGGATASLGDPSFKAEERKLLTREEIEANAENIKKQLSHIIDFDSENENKAIMVNNYDWMKDFTFLDFAREVGKLITVNYMMAKESVKLRLEREGSGLSFTEFTYQLLQGYDFCYLRENYNCKIQLGGSDQWGNIMTGTEIIRKKMGSDTDAFALVWPLATRADGKKFGKSEGGTNIWLDPTMTTPYQFYQFWLNQSDDDAERFIKMFTLLPKEEIEALIEEHKQAPHLRVLQKRLAKEVTIMVHSEEDYNVAVEASNVLFGGGSIDTIKKLDDNTILSVFEGVPTFEINKETLVEGVKLTELSVERLPIFKSKGDLRKLIKGGGISINKEKISDDIVVNTSNLINDKFLLVQQGKKNYNLVIAN